MELFDIPVSGKKYSWFSPNGNSVSRLDMFLILEGLIELWVILGQWIGSRDISDHCPIWLLRSLKDYGPKRFRVFNAWFDHEKFLPYVKECWESFTITGRKAYVVKEKFQMHKEKLKSWNREVYGKLELNIEGLVRDMNALDLVLSEGWDNNVVMNRKEVSATFWKQLHSKEAMLSQKSRERWIKEGDMNSKYFHSLLKYRRRRCNVVIVRDNGEMVEEVEVVKSTIMKHFKDCFVELYFSRPTLDGLSFKQLTGVDVDSLIEPFSEDELSQRCGGVMVIRAQGWTDLILDSSSCVGSS